NLGPGTPAMYFDQWENEDEIEVRLLLKGGGCENKNIQYSLPMEIPHLGKAGRDLDGVRKCILHAVWQAQGQGCSAGAIGVCIGGDRAQGYLNAKEQLFRLLDDTNAIPELAKLEDYVMQTANTLGIGTMGFGGGATLIGCKIGVLNRLPASFFVSVAYDCWAFRRLGVVLDAAGAIDHWLYRDPSHPIIPMLDQAGFVRTGREVALHAPLTEEQVRSLKEHGAVYLNAIGGAAQFYARTIERVDDVSLMEFGTPEAMWHLTVTDFPAIVTMDAHGNSLHKDIEQESGQHLEAILA